MTSIGNFYADHSVFNTVGGHQINYNVYPSPATDRANPLHYAVFNAPVDILSVHFTGRENDLNFLQAALSESHSGVPSRCAVYGMPGLGKTQLLLRYARLCWDQHFYSCIVWISATSVDKISQGISGILDLTEHPDRYLQDQTAKLTAAKLWLEKYEVGDWLLVFDNVKRETLSFLRDHLPLTNERGNILFSTRTEDVAESLVNAAGEQHPILGLQPMELRDTANLLFADAGIDAGMATPSLFSQAEDLVEQVGRLPLAVTQAASYMKQTHTTLDDMVNLYKGGRKTEVVHWENDLSSYEERSVARTILNQINELDQQSYHISNLLKLLSFLDPENIPVEMIVDGAEVRLLHLPESVLSPDFDSLITLVVSPVEFQTAIQKLQSLSLVEHRFHNGSSSLWIHDLIQFMVREHARKDGTYQEWLQLSWSLVYGVFLLIGDPSLPQGWADCERLVPHLRSLSDAWNESGGMSYEMTHANNGIAAYFRSRGRHGEAEALSKQVLEEAEKYLGTDHLDTLIAVNNLAEVYSSQGRYSEAESLHKRALEEKEKHLGTDHPSTLASVHNFASVHSSQGRYDEAEGLYIRALEGLEKHLGNDHPNTLLAMNNLACVYELQGRYAEAEELYKEALNGGEKYLGINHPDTHSSASNLAVHYSLQGRYNEAEVLHKRALEGREKLLGTDHPDTLVSLNNLADVYLSLGRSDEAESLCMRASERNLGSEHSQTR